MKPSPQSRYPVPHTRGEEEQYVRIDALTPAQLKWNVERMQARSRVLTAHADALAIYASERAAGNEVRVERARGGVMVEVVVGEGAA